jgi:hypothetical protein
LVNCVDAVLWIGGLFTTVVSQTVSDEAASSERKEDSWLGI